jgi:hypothetical protein
MIDRLEQGGQVRRRPRLLGRRHQRERQRCVLERRLQGLVPPPQPPVEIHDPHLDAAAALLEQRDDGLEDSRRGLLGRFGQEDDAHPRARKWLAMRVGCQRIVVE